MSDREKALRALIIFFLAAAYMVSTPPTISPLPVFLGIAVGAAAWWRF